MGVMESLSRMFGGKGRAESPKVPIPPLPVEVKPHGDPMAGPMASPATGPGAGPGAGAPNGAAGATPIAVRRVDDDDENFDTLDGLEGSDSMSTALQTKKGRAEMLNQLRKNYDEVLGIVRKVDQHLDEQAARSERMLEIAERTAKQLERLEQLGPMNESTARVAEAMTQLIQVTQQGQADAATTGDRMMKTANQQLEAQQQQTATLHQVQATIHKSAEADKELADSIHGFTDSIGGVKTATSELGQAITAMRETDAERERELAQLVARSQKSLIAIVVIAGIAALGALAAVLAGIF